MSEKNLDRASVIKLLLDNQDTGIEKKIVVLFDDTHTMRKVSESIGRELIGNSNLHINNKVPLKVAHNLIRVNNTTIFLGIKAQEDLLSNNYPEESIRYYSDDTGNN